MKAGVFRILLVTGCAVAAGWVLFFALEIGLPTAGAAPQNSPQPVADSEPANPRRVSHFVGVGSCAAAGCHGGTVGKDPHDPKWREYSIWMQSDPHAIAYITLFSQRSQQIARNLGYKNAHTEQVCLNCHSLAADDLASTDKAPDAKSQVVVPPRALADGVSCEACHGAAGNWIEIHKRDEWKTYTAEQKAEYGFYNTKTSIHSRTTKCLNCHVGEAGRDVDHDLIAAGHPRLYFEMAAYHSKMPAHWNKTADEQRNPALEAKLWLVGQFATADAALGLLDYRATSKKDDRNAPWPEFAEYGCFSCHHDLAAPSWRQKLATNPHPGLYRWGTWNFPMVKDLAKWQDRDLDANSFLEKWKAIEEPMSQTMPPRDKVAGPANDLITQLRTLAQTAESRSFDDKELRELAAYLTGEITSVATQDWETATQLYLGLYSVALTGQDRPVLQDSPLFQPATANQLKSLRDLLVFPKKFGNFRFSSPGDFDEARIQEVKAAVDQLRPTLGAK
jgi:hypothetical protein